MDLKARTHVPANISGNTIYGGYYRTLYCVRILSVNKSEQITSWSGEGNYYPATEINRMYKDLPFVNSSIINDLLISCSEDYQELCTKIKNNEIYIFNVDTFENFIEMIKDETFNIEWLFNEQKNNPDENLNSIMQKKYGSTLLRNSYLENIFNDIFQDIIPEDYDK